MAIIIPMRKKVHANCGGEIERLAIKDRMGVQIRCKKCGKKEIIKNGDNKNR